MWTPAFLGTFDVASSNNCETILYQPKKIHPEQTVVMAVTLGQDSGVTGASAMVDHRWTGLTEAFRRGPHDRIAA